MKRIQTQLFGTAALLCLLIGYPVAFTGDDPHPSLCDPRQAEMLQLSDMRLLFPDQTIGEPVSPTGSELV